MAKVDLYREVFNTFKDLCQQGSQPCSFNAYCKAHGVRQSKMRQMLKGEYQSIRTLPGYTSIGSICREIYEDFRNLCAEGKQPGTFRAYYQRRGVTVRQMDHFQRRNKLLVAGLPGFTGPSGIGLPHCKETPFENVIFEEAGFLPPGVSRVITVHVYGHVAVSFPAGTDVEVVAKFIRKMGKEAGHVGTE